MASTEWETPQDFFDTLNAEFHFTLDVCATAQNAKCLCFLGNNGLDYDWSNHVVWMNPPYGRGISGWLPKAYVTAQRGGIVVALIQGRSSDAVAWHECVMRASEIRYIKNRLHFGLNGQFARSNISSVVVVFWPYCQGPPIVSSINTQGMALD